MHWESAGLRWPGQLSGCAKLRGIFAIGNNGFTAENAEEHVEIDEITEVIIGAAILVHRELGPGLLESTYRTCLAYELLRQGLRVEQEKALPIIYDGVTLETGYRLDLLVENSVIVELKVADRIEPVHIAQVLTYLKLSRCQAGLLLNFNVVLMKDGIRRLVMNHREAPRRPRRPPR